MIVLGIVLLILGFIFNISILWSLGVVLLVKEWGRIGAHARMVAEHYDTEALAAAALQRQAERKRRRGYAILHLTISRPK